MQLPGERIDALRSAQETELVRLLGPFDPFLQAGDRTLLVPDTTVHKALWPVLGRPGVLLVDGDVLGSWRSTATRTRLTLAVEPFAPLPQRVWTQVEAEAARVGEARRLKDIAVTRKS